MLDNRVWLNGVYIVHHAIKVSLPMKYIHGVYIVHHAIKVSLPMKYINRNVFAFIY